MVTITYSYDGADRLTGISQAAGTINAGAAGHHAGVRRRGAANQGEHVTVLPTPYDGDRLIEALKRAIASSESA